MGALETAKRVLGEASAAGATRILVGLSGGKDSLITLDLCVRHFGAGNVEAFYMSLVDMDFELLKLDAASARYTPAIPVHVVPHWQLAGLYKRGIMRMPSAAAKALKSTLSLPDVEAHLRLHREIDWFAYGDRAADSVFRNARLRRCNGVELKPRRVFPIFDWKKPDVRGYLNARGIRSSSIVGGGTYSGGVSLRPECLRWIRDHHPKDFARLEAKFPLARAVILREELRLAEAARQEEAAARQGGEGERPA